MVGPLRIPRAKFWCNWLRTCTTGTLSGFHLDIDSRDGKILVLRNKGWRGQQFKGCLSNVFQQFKGWQGMANELQGMVGAIARHPLKETLLLTMYVGTHRCCRIATSAECTNSCFTSNKRAPAVQHDGNVIT